MNTPICDFVRSYIEKNAVRLHMPGHKGESLLGFEGYDITEIKGADSLYEANGIIKESEENASKLFGSYTYYSAEGSSLAIRAMLYLTCLFSEEKGERPLILAGRNVHKVFVSSAALLDFDVEWLVSEKDDTYLSCRIMPEDVERKLISLERKPAAVYLTSPDYLGNESDICEIAKVCHKYGVLLLVDNAHGAYLKFLPESRHPIDMGADMCCDSAHKTLPVLTGGAYLHIAGSAPEVFKERAKDSLSLFGSTSPSYLLLQSLDAMNAYIDDSYKKDLTELVVKISEIKEKFDEYIDLTNGNFVIGERIELYREIILKDQQIYELVKDFDNLSAIQKIDLARMILNKSAKITGTPTGKVTQDDAIGRPHKLQEDQIAGYARKDLEFLFRASVLNRYNLWFFLKDLAHEDAHRTDYYNEEYGMIGTQLMKFVRNNYLNNKDIDVELYKKFATEQSSYFMDETVAAALHYNIKYDTKD